MRVANRALQHEEAHLSSPALHFSKSRVMRSPDARSTVAMHVVGLVSMADRTHTTCDVARAKHMISTYLNICDTSTSTQKGQGKACTNRADSAEPTGNRHDVCTRREAKSTCAHQLETVSTVMARLNGHVWPRCDGQHLLRLPRTLRRVCRERRCGRAHLSVVVCTHVGK
jgi:hypothetical protein